MNADGPLPREAAPDTGPTASSNSPETSSSSKANQYEDLYRLEPRAMKPRGGKAARAQIILIVQTTHFGDGL
ncbi:hypothetical protein BGZ97_008859, partial [Linnemannia gamsii]